MKYFLLIFSILMACSQERSESSADGDLDRDGRNASDLGVIADDELSSAKEGSTNDSAFGSQDPDSEEHTGSPDADEELVASSFEDHYADLGDQVEPLGAKADPLEAHQITESGPDTDVSDQVLKESSSTKRPWLLAGTVTATSLFVALGTKYGRVIKKGDQDKQRGNKKNNRRRARKRQGAGKKKRTSPPGVVVDSDSESGTGSLLLRRKKSRSTVYPSNSPLRTKIFALETKDDDQKYYDAENKSDSDNRGKKFHLKQEHNDVSKFPSCQNDSFSSIGIVEEEQQDQTAVVVDGIDLSNPVSFSEFWGAGKSSREQRRKVRKAVKAKAEYFNDSRKLDTKNWECKVTSMFENKSDVSKIRLFNIAYAIASLQGVNDGITIAEIKSQYSELESKIKPRDSSFDLD